MWNERDKAHGRVCLGNIQVCVCVCLKKCMGDTSLASRSTQTPHRTAHQFCGGTGLTVTPGSPALHYKKPAYALLLGVERRQVREREWMSERDTTEWEAVYVWTPPSPPFHMGRRTLAPLMDRRAEMAHLRLFAGVSNDYIISSIRSSLSFMGFLVSVASAWGERRGKIYPPTPPSVSRKMHLPSSRKQGLYSSFTRA